MVSFDDILPPNRRICRQKLVLAIWNVVAFLHAMIRRHCPKDKPGDPGSVFGLAQIRGRRLGVMAGCMRPISSAWTIGKADILPHGFVWRDNSDGHHCRHPQPPIRWRVGLAHSLRPRQSEFSCNKPDADMDGALDALLHSILILILIRLDGFDDQIPAPPYCLANGSSLFNVVYSPRHW